MGNYDVISFTQGTGDNDPSIVEIVVKYLGRAICFHTFLDIDWTFAQDGDDYIAAIEEVVLSVLECVPSEMPNPNYDSSLTACWT